MSEVCEKPNTLPVSSTRITTYAPQYRDQMMELSRMMHCESTAHNKMALDEKKVQEQLMGALLMPDAIFLRLAVRGEQVIGAFFGCISNLFFSHELAAWDMGWYVKPEHRGGRASLLLIKAFETWAKDHRIRMINLSQTTGVAIEQTKKLYEHLGYRITGYNTVKEI